MVVQDTQSISPSRYPDDDRDLAKLKRREPTALGKSVAGLVLPAADTKRWSSRRRAAVVVATRTGVLTREEACERYLLSDEELTFGKQHSIGTAFPACEFRPYPTTGQQRAEMIRQG